tara:strand:+ start:573 stop:890 length:318 start_codon:yes stop_codon:yes gene_type:complete
MARFHGTPNGNIPFTTEEETQRDAEEKAWNDASAERKLAQIKEIRLQKLIKTDYLATSDNVMSDEMKNFRKSMRDIPQDYLADKYDELLTRDENGNLTHSIWSKP